MLVKIHNTATQFLKQNQASLEKKEAENNLILGIALNLKKGSLNYGSAPNIYLSVIDQGNNALCCLQTPPKNLIISGLEGYKDEALSELCNYLIKQKIDVPGVNGSKNIVEKFVKIWASMCGNSYKLKMSMGVFRLDRTRSIRPTAGKLRIAKMSELPLVIDWTVLFNSEVFEENDVEAARNFATKKIEKKEIYLWDNGVPVSMAAVARPSTNGIAINYVYTPPEFRKKGFATSCVKYLSDEMLKHYSFCSLFTDLSNPTSNAIYQNIGYYQVDDYDEYTFISGEKC